MNSQRDKLKMYTDTSLSPSLTELIIETCSVVLTIEYEGKILWCYHSEKDNVLGGTLEIYWPPIRRCQAQVK